MLLVVIVKNKHWKFESNFLGEVALLSPAWRPPHIVCRGPSIKYVMGVPRILLAHHHHTPHRGNHNTRKKGGGRGRHKISCYGSKNIAKLNRYLWQETKGFLTEWRYIRIWKFSSGVLFVCVDINFVSCYLNAYWSFILRFFRFEGNVCFLFKLSIRLS